MSSQILKSPEDVKKSLQGHKAMQWRTNILPTTNWSRRPAPLEALKIMWVSFCHICPMYPSLPSVSFPFLCFLCVFIFILFFPVFPSVSHPQGWTQPNGQDLRVTKAPEVATGCLCPTQLCANEERKPWEALNAHSHRGQEVGHLHCPFYYPMVAKRNRCSLKAPIFNSIKKKTAISSCK